MASLSFCCVGSSRKPRIESPITTVSLRMACAWLTCWVRLAMSSSESAELLVVRTSSTASSALIASAATLSTRSFFMGEGLGEVSVQAADGEADADEPVLRLAADAAADFDIELAVRPERHAHAG